MFLLNLQLEQDDALLFVLTLRRGNEESIDEGGLLQLKLGSQTGKEIKPRILTGAESFMICSDWDLKLSEDKPGWQKLAFLDVETDRKIVQKIGMEIENGGTVFVGEFCVFAKRKTASG